MPSYLEYLDGKAFTTTQASGISDSTAALQKHWFAAGTHAGRLGVFCLVPSGGQGFSTALPDQVDNAVVGNWRREGKWRSPGAAGEASRHRPYGRGLKGHRPLGNGRASKTDGGRPPEIPVMPSHHSKRRSMGADLFSNLQSRVWRCIEG